jgi:hypothetical protein
MRDRLGRARSSGGDEKRLSGRRCDVDVDDSDGSAADAAAVVGAMQAFYPDDHQLGLGVDISSRVADLANPIGAGF